MHVCSKHVFPSWLEDNSHHHRQGKFSQMRAFYGARNGVISQCFIFIRKAVSFSIVYMSIDKTNLAFSQWDGIFLKSLLSKSTWFYSVTIQNAILIQTSRLSQSCQVTLKFKSCHVSAEYHGHTTVTHGCVFVSSHVTCSTCPTSSFNTKRSKNTRKNLDARNIPLLWK